MKIQRSSISKFIKEYGDKDDFNKKRNIKFCSWIKRLYIIKMPVLPVFIIDTVQIKT